MRARLAFILSTCLAAAGCTADDLTEGPSTASTGAGGSGAGAGGAGASGGGACTGGDVCAPAAPSGWDGPFAAVSGPSGTAPACGSGYTLVQKYDAGDVAGDVTCSICDCGAVTGAQCASLTVTEYTGTDCSGAGNPLLFDGSQTCLPTSFASPYAHSLKAPVPTVSGQPSCPPSGGTPTMGEVTWTEEVVVCKADGGGSCSGGGVCLPPAPMGFPSGACVTSEGHVDCPDAFPVKTTAYSSVTDTRGCSMCDCQAPALTCSADVHGMLGTNCTGNSTAVPPDGTSCPLVPLGTPGFQSVQVAFTLDGGGCTAVGGEKTGTVEPGTEVTVCCTD